MIDVSPITMKNIDDSLWLMIIIAKINDFSKVLYFANVASSGTERWSFKKFEKKQGWQNERN